MKLTLFRYPMSFSHSAWIHQEFAKQFGISIDYTQTAVESNQLEEAIKRFRQQGGVGANVTMPHKEAAFKLCKHVTPMAKLVKSVNTLYWQNEQLWGDSTDGRGFIYDVRQNLNHTLKDQRILILGAGGAIAAILPYLIEAGAKSITIANRHRVRAKALKERFQALFNIEVLLLSELLENATQYHFDWLIQGLPAQAIDLLHPSKLGFIEGGTVYELAYPKDKPSEFALHFKSAGAKTIYDGLGMLVEQAALSFSHWTQGKTPRTLPVLSQLRRIQQQAFTDGHLSSPAEP